MNVAICIEWIGWAGVVFYITGYLLLTIGILDSKSYYFHGLNILGAIGLIIDAMYYHDKPNLVVNILWLIIGVFAIVKHRFKDLGQNID